MVWQVLDWVWGVRCSLHAPSFGSALKQILPEQLWPLARPALPAQVLIHAVPLLSSFTSMQLLPSLCSALGE